MGRKKEISTLSAIHSLAMEKKSMKLNAVLSKFSTSLPCFIFFFFVSIIGYCTVCVDHVEARDPIAMFVFGDSLVDTGNNDYIPSTARANFKPNGLDYPSGLPTGRFCNGKIISDFISKFLSPQICCAA